MSLIANSLKKAIKEKSSKRNPGPGMGLLGGGKGAKPPLISMILRLLLLVGLPTGVLIYLISVGAFNVRKEKGSPPPVPSAQKSLRKQKASPPAEARFQTRQKAVRPSFPQPLPGRLNQPPFPRRQPRTHKVEVGPQKIPQQEKTFGSLSREKIPQRPRLRPPPAGFPQVSQKRGRVTPPPSRALEPVTSGEVARKKPPPRYPPPKKKGKSIVAGARPEKGKTKAALPPTPDNVPEIRTTLSKPSEDVFQNSDFYFNRAVFFQQSQEWDKALTNYIQAAKLDPDNPDTYNNMGVIYKELGKYEAAIEEFLRAVFLDPDYAKAYNNIGVVYFMQKNYEGAIRNYQKAVEINPHNLEAFNNLAIVYKNQEQPEKAKAVLNKALSLNPDHPGTNYNLAVLYEAYGDMTPSIYYYRRFMDLGKISYPSLVFEVQKHLEALKTP
ncbi:MAG: tetratricopeptide repeat protein [Nitrospinaceae bacterium]